MPFEGAWKRCVCSTVAYENLIVLTRSLQPLHPDFAIALALAAGTVVSPCPQG